MAEKRMGFVIIESRCIDCRACMVACSVENDVPVGYHRNWVNTEGPTGTFPDLGMRHKPGNCMHCESPSCQRVCPTGATYTRPDGVVLINYDDCIGCLYCIIACPYNARYVNEEIGGPDKCTFCTCLLYTSDAADDLLCVDLGGRRIIKKNNQKKKTACEL